MPLADEFFDQHRPMLDAAVAATQVRGYHSAFPESPSPRVYGETAAADGSAAFEGWLARTFPVTTPGCRGRGVDGEVPVRAAPGHPLPARRPGRYPRASRGRGSGDDVVARRRHRGPRRRRAGDPLPASRADLRTGQRRDAYVGPGVRDGVPGGGRPCPRPGAGVDRIRLCRDDPRPAHGALGEAGARRPDPDGEDVHGRAARRRPGDRMQHVPDLELVAGPVRLPRHRQPRCRQAAPRCGAAARDHRPGLPRGDRRGGSQPRSRDARR